MITLGLVARDEGKYLKEWIAYHYVIGINKFIVYLHNCKDESEQNLKKISIPVDIRKKENEELGWDVKNEMYLDIIRSSETDYVCCLDIDEFLYLPGGEDIKEFLCKFKNIGGIALYQNVFGASGHISSPNGLVIENYVKRNPEDVSFPKKFPKFDKPYDIFKNVKVIIKRSSLKKINSSHDYVCNKPIVNENGKVFQKYKCDRKLSKIRLNHYYTKSLEDWTFKTSRERFSKSFKYPNSWFKYFNDFNYVDEELKNRYSARTKEILNASI
jgi:hypothetical protein